MVVPVFMISCQVSLNPNSGPVTAQTTMMSMAATKATGCPVAREVHLAKWVNWEPWYNISFPPSDRVLAIATKVLPATFWLSQLALDAFLVISDLCSGESFSARAYPPFRPLSLPSSCAALFVSDT